MVRKSGWMTALTLIYLAWPAPLRPFDVPLGQILGGSANSPIQIEVYSDFQCAACREFYLGTIRQVLQEYSSKDKVRVIYHEYPIRGHLYSRDAARYSAAASRMGAKQLRAVMDSLFIDQAKWSRDGKIEASIVKVLSQADFQKLKKIMQDPSVNLAIEQEVSLANKRQIRSTPTMLIRHKGKQQKVEGMVTYIVLKQFIDSMIR